MGRLLVITNLTLDGVMQSPGRPDEDTRGSFTHGGWAAPFGAMQQCGNALANMEALLFGRWTYTNFASHFPKHPENPFTAFLTNIPKYVASTTLDEPLPWSNSTLLKGHASRSVAALKQEMKGDLVVFGSGELVRSLLRESLVDELVLLIHPLVLGSGRRLFAADAFTAFELLSATSTPNGVVIATYRPSPQ